MTLSVFIIGFIVSAITAIMLIQLGMRGLFVDDAVGVQKYHSKPTPRIGGVAIFTGVLFGTCYLLFKETNQHSFAVIIVGTLPIFCGGVIEDYTKKTKPIFRLILMLVSTVVVFFAMDVQLKAIKVPGVDMLLSYGIFSFAVTLIAVSGLTNSINIIDGYNGLAGVVSLLILSALFYLAFKFHDIFLMNLCGLLIGSIFGFLIWNYPHGLIFLGDSGAYFIGFMIAVISIMLVNNHQEVSPWFPLLLCIYPVWETIFSMYRRKIIKRQSMTTADALHLHTIIHKRAIRDFQTMGEDISSTTERNSMTSVYLWLLCTTSIVPATIFWNSTLLLALSALLFIILYLWLYFRIIRFRTPKVLIMSYQKK